MFRMTKTLNIKWKLPGTEKKYYPRRPGIFERERNKPRNKTKKQNKTN